MTIKPHPASHISAAWGDAELLRPLYCALARECMIDLPSWDDYKNADSSKESVESVREWFCKADELIPVHQLRHFLQTNSLSTPEALHALLRHQLRKSDRSESDRNKIDFLLVQFFSLCVPSHLSDTQLDIAYVAQTLRPVLGEYDLTLPEWILPLGGLVQQAVECDSLKELFTSRIIEQERKLKESCAGDFYLPIALTEFTRANFILRRLFFRLMHRDLNTVLEGLRKLESAGVETLDCRKAQFSASEPVARLRMICQSWKVMFHAEYSSGQPLCLLVDLRTVVEAALAKSTYSGAEAGAEKTMAAAVGTDNQKAADLPSAEHSTAFREWTPKRRPAPSNNSTNGDEEKN